MLVFRKHPRVVLDSAIRKVAYDGNPAVLILFALALIDRFALICFRRPIVLCGLCLNHWQRG
jgi:hypothetical protein